MTATILTGAGYCEPTALVPMIRLAGGSGTVEEVTVAEEVPIAIVYNGRPYTVVMGSPLDLEDFAAGFSVTEGIVDRTSALVRTDVVRASHGVELQIELSSTDALRLADRSRALVARTACGLCGIEKIQDAMRIPEKVSQTLKIARDALFRASQALGERQAINNATNTVHAAAWANQLGEIHVVREDVGRHNALDKVLGALARSETSAGDGFIVVTSRASYEMVQKAAVFGVELVGAVSRPTGLAIRFAQLAGVTLVGLLRGQTANVYSFPERIS